MSPHVPPESGDVDMWSQVLAALGRIVLASVLYMERALYIVVPAGIAAYLFGQHFGYRGAALRLFVYTGVFVSVVGTPVALQTLGLDIELWRTVVCCGLSVFCVKGVSWTEAWIAKKLGIDRRRDEPGDFFSNDDGP